MSSEENMASTGENIENTAVNTIDSPSEEIPAEFSDPNAQDVEKQEEEKLKAKYPQAVGGFGRPGGHSAFLQKRLQKGQKYFDSGDYQMAKQKPGGGIKQIFANKVTTGDAIPTVESVPIRKTSIIQPCNKNSYTPSS